MTRMATAALIRESLSQAREYGCKQRAAKKDPEKEAPDFDAKLEALLPVVEGRLPAHFHAHRADDLATAVRIAKEFSLDYVLIHGTEGHLVADLLAREGARVVTGPIIGDRSKPELLHQSVENTARLAQAGVRVAICTDHPENPIQYLPMAAALCARRGWERSGPCGPSRWTRRRLPASLTGWAPSHPARTRIWCSAPAARWSWADSARRCGCWGNGCSEGCSGAC